jgi:hypothetical protein
LQFSYPSASIKDVQAAAKAFSPQKEREHPALQNMKFLNFFLVLWVFCPPGSDPDNKNQCGSGSRYGSEKLDVRRKKARGYLFGLAYQLFYRLQQTPASIFL